MMLKNLLEKYHNIPNSLKSSIWFAICSFLQKGVMFIVTPIYTRLLTVEEYGYYNIYQSWLSIITIFATLNLSAGVMNNCLNKKDNKFDKDNILSNFQILEIITIFLFFVILLIINFIFPNIFNYPPYILVVMGITILMNSAFSLLMTRCKFDYEYRKVIVYSIIFTFLSVFLSLMFIKTLNNKNDSLIFGFFLSSFIAYFSVLIANIKNIKYGIDFKLWKFALLFNLPLLPHYLSLSILNMSDRIMIEKICGTYFAALYSLPYTLSTIIMVIVTAINSSLVPFTYQNIKNGNINKISIITKYISKYLVFFICFVCLLGPDIIWILGGEKYQESLLVIPPVVVSIFFMFLYSLFGNIEFYYEKKIYTTFASIGAAIINIILNYIFIDKYGYIAAAYTTLFCYFLLSFFHFIFYKVIINNRFESIYDLKSIYFSSFLSFLIIIFSNILYKFSALRYIIILLLVIYFVILLIKDFHHLKKENI